MGWKAWLVLGVIALALIGEISGGSDDPDRAVPASQPVESSSQSSDDAAVREIRRERAKLRRQRAELRRERAERRAKARARRARAAARRERKRQEALAAAEAAAAAPEPEVEPPAGDCHPSYDPCLDPNASDYDCEGGSGDGPMYTGFVTVTGSDDYDLDSDGDGTGCES
jgi:hypothetical protein